MLTVSNNQKMTKAFILTLVLLSAVSSHAQNDSILYSFFVAGHTSGAAGVNNPGFYPAFKQKFDYIKSKDKIQFGILTGDIVSPNPVAQDWNEIDAEIDTLDLPIYFAVGNHDMENRQLYESRYGNTYYHFTMNDDLFIVLDPNISNWNISSNQLEYVENTLNDNKDSVNNIFLFFHQLLWVNDHNLFRTVIMNSDAGRAESINFWSELLPLFDNVKNPTVMFAGDLGAGSWSDDAMYYEFRNMTFIASGMGEGIGDNFVVANIWSNNEVTFDLIPLLPGDSVMLGQLTNHLVQEPDIKLDIFPNPTADHLRLQLSTLEEFSRINIYDLNGRSVYSSNEYETSIDVSNISDGTYIVVVEYRDRMYHRKLIKCNDC